MKTFELYTTRVLALVLTVALCGIPELAQAQSAQAGAPQSQEEQQPGMVNPSAPPLQPVPAAPEKTTNKPASSETEQSLPSAPAPAQQGTEQQPAGTAAAEGTPTAGGLASKPAGNAIAPAKQKQTRSLLIKVGAIAAAAVAVGTVVALTKGSPTQPPGTSTTATAAATRR
jgi:hypothetical protein